MICGFKAKNHPQQTNKRGALDEVDDRGTPREIFDAENEIHHFTLDAAAAPHNALCAKFFTKEVDGLAQSWAGNVVWCNPPYSQIQAWVSKAIAEAQDHGVKTVMLLPSNRTEQGWWQELIEPIRDRPMRFLNITTRFLRGRPRFVWPESRPRPARGDRPPFGLVLVVFEG